MIRRLAVVAMFLVPRGAFGACDRAEFQRLSGEQTKLAQRNAWSGVERTYDRLRDTGCDLTFDQHQLAAEAARVRGKSADQYERLQVALAVREDAAARAQLAALEENYGRVVIKGDARRPPALTRDPLPFAPDQRKSIEWAQTVLAETGRFEGLLPAGTYEVGASTLKVYPGAVDDLVTLEISRGRESTTPWPDVPSVDKPTFRYLQAVGHLGPAWLGAPQTDRVTTLPDGDDQFSPATVSVLGVTAAAGVELGINYGEPSLGVAAGLGYTGGYGLDTMHAISAWALFVVRPGRARFAMGPQYQMLFGSGTGVADWFDRGQDPSSQPRSDIRYAGWAWGPGLQAWGGYGLLDLAPFDGLVEFGGTWHSDGARSYFTLGLRLGIVPQVPRFDG